MARPVMCDGNIDLAMDIYRKAREVDEWPGEDYDGTSVLAGIKIATDKGYYSEYRWAFGLNDLLLAVGYRGPAILGINWYSSMLTPDTDGYIKVGGNISGGHAILCNGVSLRRQAVRLENSWGEDWGDDGACWLPFKDLNILLYEQGEACVPVRRHASAPWTIRGTVVRVPEIEKKEQTK
ncbi:MAG: hypothetical protein H0U23_17865 [Blastocatellia bacterium]|nr:hypothetical protein [Blastocatellia bacterium]